MLEFLLFGTLWFYIISGIIVIVAIGAIVNDNLGLNWFSVLLFITLFILSGIWSVDWILSNPIDTLIRVGIYLGIGLIWSMKEWYSFLFREAEEYVEAGIKKDLIRDKLALRNHWHRIVNWIIYFPLHMLAWVLRDPVKWLAQRFAFVYESISKHVMNKAIK